DFNENDTATAPKVGILSESLARKAFPGQNPIGKRFLAHFHPREDTPGDLIEVVGICGDTRYWWLKQSSVRRQSHRLCARPCTRSIRICRCRRSAPNKSRSTLRCSRNGSSRRSARLSACLRLCLPPWAS